jgi:hypothetical protein
MEEQNKEKKDITTENMLYAKQIIKSLLNDIYI